MSFAGPARAQSASDKALAESLFREGRSLMASGQTHEACTKLEGSFRIEPKTGTLTNLAACHALEGKTASAWAEFTEAAGRAASAKRTGVEQLARSRAAELEPKLSRLSIRLSDGASSEIRIALDGHPIVYEALAGSIPIDPGAHEVSAARGDATWSKPFVVEAGPSRTEVMVPALVASMPPPAPPKPEPPTPIAAPVVAERTTTREIVTYGVLGLSAVALGAGAILGIQTLSKKSDANALCQGAICSSQHGVDLQDEARTRATWSTIGFGVGLAAAAVGIYLLVTRPHRTGPTAWNVVAHF